MDLGIAGKVAFVSGGTKGVGRAVAEQLAREGCRVAVVARGQQAIDETVAVIRKAGGEATGISADLFRQEGINHAVELTTMTFGAPDIVISNVHGPGPGDFFDVRAEDFAEAFNNLTLSLVHLMHAVVPHMKEQRWGRLVNIGSLSAKEPPPDHKHLLATTVRASVVSMNKTVANEWGPYGITVNTIGTGYIDTGARQHEYMEKMAKEKGTTKDALMAEVIRSIPVRRFGSPDEIGAFIVFLCSQSAAYVTGNMFAVDGGWHRSAW